MTNPNLSIEVSDCSKTRRKIGRIYQLPSGNLPKKIRYAKAWEAIARKQCFPSITNVISAKAIDLTGWAKFMMGKHIRENMNTTDNFNKLLSDAQGANDRYTQLACDKGSEVHLACEENILSGKEDHNFQYGGEPYYNGYEKFIEEFKPEFLSIETTVYGKTDDKLFYAGTIDFIARINGKIYAGDWKTSKVLHEEVGIQLAAGIKAQKMVGENNELINIPWEIEGAIGVHLIPDGYSVSKVEDLDYCWETFQSLRKVWEWNAFNGNFEKEQLKQVSSPEQL